MEGYTAILELMERKRNKDKTGTQPWHMELGAQLVAPRTVSFTVWAPVAKHVDVRILGHPDRVIPMELRDRGYFEVTATNVDPGNRYHYIVDGENNRPDPASRFQPDGVHQPSAVVDPTAFSWTDQQWKGLPLTDFIIYELHVGTFTQAGTFEGIIPYLSYLKNDVGITAIELMPVAQFPGRRNWGYDGVHPFAVQESYGGPDGLKRLVDACHQMGLAVVLDVVYNHLGPEGNYLGDFGPYFTDRYRTPWGAALNYDGPDSDEVRRFFVDNALYWVTEYHIDALRLDAIHGIYDFGAHHILQELAEAVHKQANALNRTILVIAESDLNDARVITSIDEGGYGLDGQWNDDFHHALRVTLAQERKGYYQDFNGLTDLAAAVQGGFVYHGQHSAYRRRRHGNSPSHCSPSQLVVFAQNHDQIGNRAVGDRLSTQLPFDALKVARALVLLSPNIPLLFMGEEYSETAPFQYFIEHGDPALIEAVRQGRRREFSHFGWRPEEIPDPQDQSTFDRSRLHIGTARYPMQEAMLRWTKDLIELRKTVASLGASTARPAQHRASIDGSNQILLLHRWTDKGPAALVICGFNEQPLSFTLTEPSGDWTLRLSAQFPQYHATGDRQPPQKLLVQGAGMQIHLPAYGVGVYLRSR
ncbi:malto-oligosyltrehalose trehalohydrolase [Petrachloros mirabilis]